MLSFQPFSGIQGGFLGRSLQIDHKRQFIPEQSIQLNQVHGDRIIVLDSLEAISAQQDSSGDALVCLMTGRSIAVRTADCVPILLGHPSGLIGAVHAGWKGTYARILTKTLHLIADQLKLPLVELRMAIGPSICASCYEVGEDLVEMFRKEGMGSFLYQSIKGQSYLNLKAANFFQACEAGVLAQNITVHDVCTRCQNDRFFSYRVAQAKGEDLGGRNYTWISRER